MKIKNIGWGIFLAFIWKITFAANFEEGKHYQRVSLPKENALVQSIMKEAQKKIQVLEFFSYACIWCQKLDPYIENWQQKAPNYVNFQRVPVEFQPAWGNLSKAYYAQLDLKAYDKIHNALFEAISANKLSDSSEEVLKQFFVSKGIKAEDFTRVFHSFDVARRHKWANGISQAYQVATVPIVYVVGPEGTFTTSVRLTGSEQEVINVVNYLIKKQKTALDEVKSGLKVKENNKQ